MANPKRRHSNTRSRLRRSHDGLKARPSAKCNQCGAALMTHRVCKKCGFYRGKQVLVIKAKKEKESK